MKLSAASPLQKLLDTLPQQGQICWIGVRPNRKQPVLSVESVDVITQKGLTGDHFSGTVGSKRQVTLIQQEHIQAIASFMQVKTVSPEMLRRNLVVKGINLLALKDKKFWVGEVLLEYTGECHPCSRMEEILGAGGYNAVRGHGGITARILRGGKISLGNILRID
ncbi:MAG: MOSC domain-containing protein [Janthinobacterium lividum]